MVMLAGEPGIGKTRLAQELADHAQARGVLVVWGSCYEGDGAPPYWPWTNAIASFIEPLNSEQLYTIIGSGNTDIAEIVPQIARKRPDLTKPLDLDLEQARFQLFDSVATFLSNASKSSPMLIVLEDLHWADHATLLLLEFVIAASSEAPLMFLGTYRDIELGRGHPLSRTLGELVRGASFQRVHLNSFNPEEVGQFVQSRASLALEESDLALVYNRTGGNPLFLNELMRLQAEEGDADAEDWKTGLPEGVRDVIGRRLDRLSEKCNVALAFASVIGPEFGFNQLQPLLEDVAGDQLLELVEEALSARVIEELPGATGRYRFAHALIQETLNEELSMTSRVRLHVRIAGMMEATYGDDADSHAAELAHHYSQGAMITGTEKMVRYSGLAGEQALAVHAPEEALVHFQRALAVKEEQPMDGETADLLLGLGRVQVATVERHRFADAVVSLGRAFDYFVDVNDLERALIVAESQMPRVLGIRTVMGSLIERALELVPSDSHQAGRLLSRYGQEIGIASADYESAQTAFGRAFAIAEREGDEALAMRTLLAAARVDFSHAKYQEAAGKSLQVIALVSRLNDMGAELDAHRTVALSFRNMGDPKASRPHAVAGLSLAEEIGNRLWLALLLAANATLHQLNGDWSISRECTDRGFEVSSNDVTLLVSRVLVEYEVGEFNQGEALIDRMIGTMNRTEPGHPLFMRIRRWR
jgi:predicted ATPase